MASPYNYIRKLLDRSGRYYDLNEAEAALKKVREKYYVKKIWRRMGYLVLPADGTAFFEKHYGELWKQVLKLKKEGE